MKQTSVLQRKTLAFTGFQTMGISAITLLSCPFPNMRTSCGLVWGSQLNSQSHPRLSMWPKGKSRPWATSFWQSLPCSGFFSRPS